jgi:hypothetical protein
MLTSFFTTLGVGGVLVIVVGVVLAVIAWLTLRFIPNHCVGVVEKLWSLAGSVPEGRILALDGEAGFQADLLRGGIHFGYWRWQYRVHVCPLVTVPQGKIGYVYARDGQPLPPSQTLGRVVECNNFQDARAFLVGQASSLPSAQAENGRQECLPHTGQRGRQLAILREGVYAINPALFVVLTETAVYTLRQVLARHEVHSVHRWQEELSEIEGFSPVIIGRPIETVDPLHP